MLNAVSLRQNAASENFCCYLCRTPLLQTTETLTQAGHQEKNIKHASYDKIKASEYALVYSLTQIFHTSLKPVSTYQHHFMSRIISWMASVSVWTFSNFIPRLKHRIWQKLVWTRAVFFFLLILFVMLTKYFWLSGRHRHSPLHHSQYSELF